MTEFALPPGIVPKPKKTAPALPPGIVPKNTFSGAPQKAPVSPIVGQPITSIVSGVPMRAPQSSKPAPALQTNPYERRAPAPGVGPMGTPMPTGIIQTRVKNPLSRGVANLEAGLGAAASRVQLEKLRALDAIDRMTTRGRPSPSGFRSEAAEAELDKALPRTGEQDPLTYATALGDLDIIDYAKATTPEERAAVRQRVGGVLESQIGEVVSGSVRAASIPKNPSVAKAQAAKSFGEFWDAFTEAPGTFITDTVLESAPNMIPTIIGGAVGGPIGGRVGFAAGAGGASGLVELGSSIAQKIEEFGADMEDPESIRRVLEEHEAEIFEYARNRAIAVGLFDAMGARLAAGKMVPGKPVAEAAAQTVAGAGTGAGGEIAAALNTGEQPSVGAVMSEAFGEVAGQAGEVATAGAEGLRTQPPVNRRSLEQFVNAPPQPQQSAAQPPQAPQASAQPKTTRPTRATPGDGTAAAPRVVTTPEDLTEASSQAATSPMNPDPEPTQAQKEAGNYKKSHVRVQGLDISIENPKGSTRSGTGPEGSWSVTMPAHYGYVRRSEAADGDQIDVFIGDQPDAPEAYVIDQLDPTTGAYDEPKIVIGVPDMVSAIQTYDASFSGGGQDRIGAVTPLSIDELKTWLKSDQTKSPIGNIAAAQKVIRDRLAERQALAAQPGAAPAVPNQTQPAPRPLPQGIVPKSAAISRGRRQAWVSIAAIAKKWGGIKDVSGDLAAMGMLRARPGVINNRSGRDIDAFGEHLFQTPEYRDLIRSDNDPDTWDTGKVLELLRQDLAGWPPVPRGSEIDQIEEQDARRDEEFRAKMRQDADAHARNLLARDLEDGEFNAILEKYVSESYDSIEDAVTDQLESDVIADVQARESKYYGQEDLQARSEDAPARDRRERSDERGPEGPPGRSPPDEARERSAGEDQDLSRQQGPKTELTDQGEQAVMPGMERSARQAAQARDAKRGGKMGTDRAQAEPGGMFQEKPDDRQTDIEQSAPARPKGAKKPSKVDRLENYFRAGREVPAYGGIDRVVSFQRNETPAGWQVQVREIDPRGGPDGPARWHTTEPTERRLMQWEKLNPISMNSGGLSNTGQDGSPSQPVDMTLSAAMAVYGSPRQANSQAAEWTVKLGKQTGREYAVVLDAQGKVVSASSGTDERVEFGEATMAAFDDSANSFIVHHNHPVPVALSNVDIYNLARPGIGFVIAHNHDGTFSAARIAPGAREEVMTTGAKATLEMVHNRAWNLMGVIVDLNERQNAVAQVLAGVGLIDYHTSMKPRAGFVSLVAQATGNIRKELVDAEWQFAASGNLYRPATYQHASGAMAAISRINAESASERNRLSRPDGMGPGRGGVENRRRAGTGTGADHIRSKQNLVAERNPSTLEQVAFEARTFGNPNASNVATRAAGQQVQLDILKQLHRPGWRAAAERRLRSFRLLWRDRFATMADIEKYIEGKTGQKTPAQKSFYKQEEVFTGKVADQLQQFHEGMLKELYDAMDESGLSVKEIEKYLVAKHAPERNATIAAINPDLPDGGSGMTDAQAQAVIDGFRQKGKLQVLQRVSDAVKKIRRFDLETRIRAGLIEASAVAEKLRDWPNYVPLKGFEELFTDDELVGRARPRLGSGFSVKNREYFSAMGRSSEAQNILANLISQAEESVVRAEKTKVSQVLADFIAQNPDPSFWSVDLVTTKRVIDPDTGLVTVQHTRMPSLEDEEQFVIYFKRDGQLHRIWIANPRLVANIRNMSANELPKWTKALQIFATIFRAVNVNANPEFVIPNAVRDLETGLVQALQHKAPGLKRKMVKYWPQAAKASWGGYGGKGGPSGSWKGWYRRMARAGGKVDFFNIDDIESQVSNINREMFHRTGRYEGPDRGVAGTIRRAGGVPWAKVETGVRGIYRLIDRANHAVENAVRLASFRAMVEAGFTDAEAASVSKNITVNFNRRGEVSRWANLLWPFFNAAVQGTFTLGSAAARSGKVRGALIGLTMMGFAEGIANGLASAGGDDGDDESDFDKIPEYIRRKNIIIMNPGHPGNGGPPYWTLPIGYGLNVFWNAGREMSDIALGKKTIGEALGNVGVSAADAFIPIDIDSLTGLLPSFAQAPGEVLANQDYSGKPVYREPTETEKKANLPDSSITRPGTNEVWKAIASGLNKMSGGSDYEPGLFDFHPESMEHIFKTYAGGVGSIISRTGDLLSPEPGDSFELGKVPVIRKVIGYFPRSTESNRYYENRGEIQEVTGRLKAAEEAGDDQAAERFATEGERQLGLEGELKSSEKRLAALRKEAREVRKEPGMPEAERKAALSAIYEEMDAETSGFNKTFYQEIERPRQIERSPTIRPMFEKKRKDVRATLTGEF